VEDLPISWEFLAENGMDTSTWSRAEGWLTKLRSAGLSKPRNRSWKIRKFGWKYLVQGIFEDDLVLDGLNESHDLAAFKLGFF
jgi:hypothetical protein